MFASKTFGVARLLSRNTALWRRSICSPAMRTTLFRQKASIQIRAFSSAVEKEKNAVKEAKESAKEGLVNGSKPKISAIQANVAGFTIGFVASALGSMVGLGGGFIIIPLLTAFGGLTQHQAASCSLASICVNAIVGTGTYISQGLIDVPAAVVITATSMIMARYGSKWSHNFESKKLKRYYGWLCLIVAPLLPLKTRIMQKRKEEEAQQAAQQTEDLAEENAKMGYRDCLSKEAMMNSEVVEHTPLLLSLGLVAGTMSGFFGVGGGIIVSPSLCLFTQMAPKKIMGTSLASMIIPTSISAHLSHKHGNLIVSTALPICAGSVLGGYVGSKIAGKMPAKRIQWVLVGLLLLAGVKSVLLCVCWKQRNRLLEEPQVLE